jgi:hypothetical protein
VLSSSRSAPPARRRRRANYNVGQELVEAYMKRAGGDRWAAFRRVIALPMIAGDLR